MFNIKVSDIIKNASNNAVFKRGVNYFKANKVNKVQYDRISNVVLAQVLGSENYHVEIWFDDDGKIEDVSCDCQACYSWNGYCKHIVAALLYIVEASKVQQILKPEKLRADKKILEFFQYKLQDMRKLIKIEYNLEVDSSKYIKLWLRLGDNRMYNVKNIKSFIEALMRCEEIYFGKQLTFSIKDYKFEQTDNKIIDFLIDIYRDYDNISGFTWGYSKNYNFDGKYLILNNNNLKILLNLLENSKTFKVYADKLVLENVEIKNEDMPLEFSFYEENNTLCLSIENDDNLMPFTYDGEYFLKGNTIYKISDYQKKNILPFYENIMINNNNSIPINNDIAGQFFSHIYPTMKQLGNVKIHETVKNRIQKHELNSKVYLDREGDKITAIIKNNYGEYEFNPLRENELIEDKDKIILRDVQKENDLQEYLSKYNFKVSKENYFIDNENDIYDFLMYGLEELKSRAFVYYSNQFKQTSAIKKKPLSTNITYNNGEDYLTFDFSIDGIDDTNLIDILNSFKEKKKFYKLSDGSLLSLQNSQFEQFIDLLDYTNISDEDIKLGNIKLPKYRAYYLNEQLDEMKIKSNKKNMGFKQLIMRLKEPKDENYCLPNEVDGILRDYQEIGYNWLRMLSEYSFGGILADDMGLGKTIQMLAFLRANHQEGNKSKLSLIVAPTSLIYNWLSEAEKFIPSLNIKVIDGSKDERDVKLNSLDNTDVIITSYTLARNDIDIYEEINFDTCILDEAQHIKNFNSKTAKAVKKVKAKNKFALTGTPIENSLSELWSVFDFIMPGYLYNITKFRESFEKPIVKQQNEKALLSLRKHISPFIIRRIKKDVLEDLPDKIENKIIVELNESQKKVYLAYLYKYKEEIENLILDKGFAKSQIKILAALTRMRQICCHPKLFLDDYNEGSSKLDLLLELLDELLEGKHRVLIFSQFTSMLKLIIEKLQEKDIDYFYLDGATKPLERHHMVNDFNNGMNQAFLISLKAGGTGLNLTGADTVIHFDPWWNPAVEQQAEDRAYRIGQEKVVHVMKLITKGTIEEKIYALQQRKKEMIDSIIKPGQTMLTKLNEEEIRDLFDITR
ncbi:DEAD/DEAH box helicase [Abyssisolibacter fermentans]|uniref:DEAD/DEAH box helicase n=1 Tax=Abyssisolibacter fermentans TaxID=1766203 RepID=UPI000830F607|nr:DEAD/DEAH box helicase [Abyssisolibacter fermentans]